MHLPLEIVLRILQRLPPGPFLSLSKAFSEEFTRNAYWPPLWKTKDYALRERRRFKNGRARYALYEVNKQRHRTEDILAKWNLKNPPLISLTDSIRWDYLAVERYTTQLYAVRLGVLVRVKRLKVNMIIADDSHYRYFAWKRLCSSRHLYRWYRLYRSDTGSLVVAACTRPKQVVPKGYVVLCHQQLPVEYIRSPSHNETFIIGMHMNHAMHGFNKSHAHYVCAKKHTWQWGTTASR